MSKSVIRTVLIMLQVLASSSFLVRARTTKNMNTIADWEKEVVRSNPEMVNFAVDPDSIPWGRQNSPDGDKDDVLMAESALDSG